MERKCYYCYNRTLKMDYFPDIPTCHQEPASFSFEKTSTHELPQRSISSCLRLKTNESIEDRTSVDFRKDSKKHLKTQESQLEVDHCRRLAQEENELRIESLVKQYELRLSKQEEYYGLREWKMKEELENLEHQNLMLSD
jgi:hypothetical protein